MKANRFKRSNVPDIAGKGAEHPLKRAEAVALIAAHITSGPGDDQATLRNRVSSALNYAESKGQLRPLRNRPSKEFALGELIRVAHAKWPELVETLPRQFNYTFDVAINEVAAASDSVGTLLLPGDVPRCHELIYWMDRNITRLEGELARAQAAMATKRPKRRSVDNS